VLIIVRVKQVWRLTKKKNPWVPKATKENPGTDRMMKNSSGWLYEAHNKAMNE
jgi:hypothetical protein